MLLPISPLLCFVSKLGGGDSSEQRRRAGFKESREDTDEASMRGNEIAGFGIKSASVKVRTASQPFSCQPVFSFSLFHIYSSGEFDVGKARLFLSMSAIWDLGDDAKNGMRTVRVLKK
jgi:hypothetical protein